MVLAFEKTNATFSGARGVLPGANDLVEVGILAGDEGRHDLRRRSWEHALTWVLRFENTARIEVENERRHGSRLVRWYRRA